MELFGNVLDNWNEIRLIDLYERVASTTIWIKNDNYLLFRKTSGIDTHPYVVGEYGSRHCMNLTIEEVELFAFLARENEAVPSADLFQTHLLSLSLIRYCFRRAIDYKLDRRISTVSALDVKYLERSQNIEYDDYDDVVSEKQPDIEPF